MAHITRRTLEASGRRRTAGPVSRAFALVAIVSGLALPSCTGASAQESTVQGRVRDEEGAAVRGATISLYRDGIRLHGDDTDRLG
ncbi:MAG: hypothetical protein GWN71_20420, partial [Gammaproteobacteria bacterium]|nr:hypothetical protein [Gemmatimonadota bacterium]NIU75844.1 hypothetical protein [Gammaproteobacteria bacterium]NIY09759.1 hypothetical protein [Gemmatimonadota bacterium]